MAFSTRKHCTTSARCQHYFSCIQQEGPLDDEDRWVQMLVLASLGGPRTGLIGPSIHANKPMMPTRHVRPKALENCPLPRKELFNCLRINRSRLRRRSIHGRDGPWNQWSRGPYY